MLFYFVAIFYFIIVVYLVSYFVLYFIIDTYYLLSMIILFVCAPVGKERYLLITAWRVNLKSNQICYRYFTATTLTMKSCDLVNKMKLCMFL